MRFASQVHVAARVLKFNELLRKSKNLTVSKLRDRNNNSATSVRFRGLTEDWRCEIVVEACEELKRTYKAGIRDLTWTMPAEDVIRNEMLRLIYSYMLYSHPEPESVPPAHRSSQRANFGGSAIPSSSGIIPAEQHFFSPVIPVLPHQDCIYGSTPAPYAAVRPVTATPGNVVQPQLTPYYGPGPTPYYPVVSGYRNWGTWPYM